MFVTVNSGQTTYSDNVNSAIVKEKLVNNTYYTLGLWKIRSIFEIFVWTFCPRQLSLEALKSYSEKLEDDSFSLNKKLYP